MRSRKETKRLREQAEQENKEEFELDLDDPEYEAAATKIQAGYKGMRARKQVKKKKQEEEEELAATKIQAGYKGMRARKQVKKMREEAQAEEDDDVGSEAQDELASNFDDPEYELAATKIQAGYKGMKARKQVKKMREENPDEANDEEEEKEDNTSECGIDLDDPEYELAATKIQAGYKGMRARRKVKKMKEEEVAATKIQAGYKGMQARRQAKKMREESEMMAGGRYQKLELRSTFPPDAEEAATVIQAGFRGMKARQQIQMMKKDLTAEGKKDAVGFNRRTWIVGKGRLWIISFIYKYETSTTYPL